MEQTTFLITIKPTIMSEKKSTVFERLSSINVNDHVEKKDNLTYLSWAWAWSVTKKECPDASYQILPTDYDEDLGFMCHTSVTIEGQTLEMWLPVMDGKNKSMKKKPYTYSTKYGEKQVDAATTFDINKTLMRCLVKNLAMFGLGIYIYAGEDLPEGEAASTAPAKAAAPAAAAPKAELIELKKDSENWDSVVKYVTANKAQGIEAIGKQLMRKYKISPALKKEIASLCQ
jgi:Protein of unknown function (DUF1071)